MVTARSGGICGSPLSSEDDDDVFHYDGDKENRRPMTQVLVSKATSASKRTPKLQLSKRDSNAGAGSVARRALMLQQPTANNPAPKTAASGVAKPTQSLKRKRKDGGVGSNKAMKATHTVAPTRVSKKELVRNAPMRFATFLSKQLDATTQAQLCEEFGFGQGYMLRMPTTWSEVRERRRFAEWVSLLGFVASSVHRHVYRISSLNVAILLPELRLRVPRACTDSELGDFESIAMPTTRAVNDDTGTDGVTEPETEVDTEDQAASLLSFKEHFEKLDQQELEMLSATEHERLLSTIRHEEIADAMEDVLARPSVRKDRDRARRMSKLGRISGRRISLIPMRQSSIAPIMEEVESEDAEEKGEVVEKETADKAVCGDNEQPEDERLNCMTLQGGSNSGDGDFVMMEEHVLVAPARRSSVGKVSRRSSVGQLSPVVPKVSLGRNLLNVLLHSGYMTVSELKDVAAGVSKLWREIAIPAYAWAVADYATQSQVLSMDQVYQDCPRGHYLSDGAYKEVFKVYSSKHKRLEAVSVMDIRAIESTGNQHIVRQEVAHSVLLSELVRSRFSPHFVEIYDVFLARERPEIKRWGSALCRKPVDLLTGAKTNVDLTAVEEEPITQSDSLFQYIHMEFCDGGDVEDFIGLQENKLLPVNAVVVPFFFQMVFSLYSARERFQLRHCDIKLLNFFLKDISRKGLKCAEDEALTLRYAVGEVVFDVQMPATFSYWVKLADYGTADSNVNNLGKPVTMDQFTTLENTPIEFLLEGDAAQQSFAADTFSLGLCLFHLFTGSAPYEEILERVLCPQPLLLDLKRLWLSGKKNSGFSVLRRVTHDDPDNVLVHTLYRYIVLFGLPTDNPSANKQLDRVWDILVKHLRPDERGNAVGRSSRRAVKAQGRTPKDQFEEDRTEFSVDAGSHPTIQRARERMARIVGARALLYSLVAFNPADRPTMKDALLHDMFKSVRATGTTPERVVHYSIDCYSANTITEQKLPNV